jgi:transposase
LRQASIDLSLTFISGTQEAFPAAAISFDRFIVVNLLTEGMDRVRHVKRKEHAALKGHNDTSQKPPKTCPGSSTLRVLSGQSHEQKRLI